MSTIGTNSEDLILNADGSGSDIKFKSNGTEVASISDGGVVTATTFTGASTDATKLPLAGGALTGDVTLTTGSGPKIKVEETGGSYIEIEAGGSTGHIKSKSGHDITFSPGGTNHLQLYSSGRAKSQFTIAAWVNFNGTGTVAIRDSHNVSSMGDWGTGQYGIYFTSGFANSNYAYASMAQDSRIVSVERDNGKPDGSRLDVSCERSWDAALTDNETLSVLVIGDKS